MGKNNAGINDLARVIGYLRSNVYSEWQLQQIQIFLEVAKHHPQGITQTDLGERINISQAAISRNCRTLALFGDKQTREMVGLDLVYMTPDPFEGRKLNVRLSKKGEKVYADLTKILEGGLITK